MNYDTVNQDSRDGSGQPHYNALLRIHRADIFSEIELYQEKRKMAVSQESSIFEK